MTNIIFPFKGAFLYPITNLTKNLIVECKLRFFGRMKTTVTDAAKYESFGGETGFKTYLQDNMPAFMKDTMGEVRGEKALLFTALGGPRKDWEEAVCQAAEAPLSQFGLHPETVEIAILELDEADLNYLKEQEDNEKLEKIRRAAVENMYIDAPMPPSFVSPITPGPFPSAPHTPRNCKVCGKQNITGRFCPECGSHLD